MKFRVLILNIISIIALLSLGFSPMGDGGESYWARQLRLKGKINLPVKPIRQARFTSCGETVITMAYNYAYPEERVKELDVIDYALRQGYFTENRSPFTSPQDMLKVAEHFANTISSGSVYDSDEGWELLTKNLTSGDPVIIDIVSRLDDLDSGAHFVLVTGLVIDAKNPNKNKILFNDPLTGSNRWGYWFGVEGVWNAWQNNGDPDGAGWWMVIASP